MNEPLIFEAQRIGLFTNVLLPLIATLLLIGIAIFINKKEVAYENRNLKKVGEMLSWFGILLLIGITIFSTLNYMRIDDVTLHKNSIQFSGNDIPFNDISRVYLHQDLQSSHISAQIIKDTTYLLVVQERKGKTHVFSEENYPVKEMVVKINEQMKRK